MKSYVGILAYKVHKDSLITFHHAYFRSNAIYQENLHVDAFESIKSFVEAEFFEWNWSFAKIDKS